MVKRFMSIRNLVITASLVLTTQVLYAAEPHQCQQQRMEGSQFEMCLVPAGAFRHDLYTLKVDGVLLLVLVDDFAESVDLAHKVPEGPSLEFPLSRKGENPIHITGGCVPESKDGLEVARICNFLWGKVQIIRDVRFEFKQ